METWQAVPGSADYAKHCPRLLWAVYEAACLLHGVEPPEDPLEFASLYVNKRTLNKSAAMYNELSTAYEDVKGATLRKLIWWEEAPGNVDWGYGLRKVDPSQLVAWARDKRGYVLPAALADFFKEETPKQRRARLRDRRDALKKDGTKNWLQTLAKEEGVGPSRMKQLLGDKSEDSDGKPRPAIDNSLGASLARAQARPSSKHRK